MTKNKTYLTRSEVSQCYPITRRNLARLACSGRGPSYAIVGNRAIYDRIEVEAWLESKFQTPRKAMRRPIRSKPTKLRLGSK